MIVHELTFTAHAGAFERAAKRRRPAVTTGGDAVEME